MITIVQCNDCLFLNGIALFKCSKDNNNNNNNNKSNNNMMFDLGVRDFDLNNRVQICIASILI